MCKEDFRLASKTRSASRRAETSVVSTEIAPYSPDRVSITICAHTAGRLFISNRTAASPEVGLFIPANTQSVTFNVYDHPDWVRGPLFAQCPDGGVGFGIIETFLDPEEYE